MGKDHLDPWSNFQQSPWLSSNQNNGNSHLPIGGHPISNPSALPEHTNPFGQAAAAGAMPPSLGGCNFFFQPSDAPTRASVQKRFLIFDQSGDRTSLVFSAMSPPVWNLKPRYPQQKPLWHPGGLHPNLPGNNRNYNLIDQSDETNVSDDNGIAEMHEDSDEIDALLYSDSEEEETSTGCSPDEMMETNEEVASSGAPTKRRRFNDENDTALNDTASSSRLCRAPQQRCKDTGENDRSSWVKCSARDGVDERDLAMASDHKNISSNKKRPRDRLHETVCVLRRIVPGGKGKDAAMVLDKAIRYLRSLRLKAKGPVPAQ